MNKGCIAEKVLIYRLGSLGDIIMTLPSFHLIRAAYPSAHITILTNKPSNQHETGAESVLKGTGLYDAIIEYPLRLRNPRILRNLLTTIKKENFDLCFFLAPRGFIKSLRDYLFLKACGIRRFVGLPRRWSDVYPAQVLGEGLYRWEAERLVGRLRTLNYSINVSQAKWWDLRLSGEEHQIAQSILAANQVARPFIVASVASKVTVKDWGEDNWKGLFSKLSDLYPSLSIVTIGVREEWDRSERVLSVWKGSKSNLCGLLSPRISAAIIARASLFIGHDGGAMHLAGAVGTPCLAIFSARNLPGQWYPAGNNNRIIYHKTSCSGCGLEVCKKYDKMCILSISVNEVFQEARRFLEILEPSLKCKFADEKAKI